MPYSIKKSGSGYKVHSPGRTYSKKPQSKKMAQKQLAAIKMHTHEGRTPRMTEVFQVREAGENLSQQLKTATPITANKVAQQATDAANQQRATMQGVSKTQGAVVKQGKTDPANPIANVFVQKPDGSADVLDRTTGQLKPVPGIQQSKMSGPVKPAGTLGTA